MSKQKKKLPKAAEENVLAFDEAQQLTVGEAARKEAELKAGIKETDSVLDRYIKQHREEVTSKKFDAKSVDLEKMSIEELDSFIAQQREKLNRADKGDTSSRPKASAQPATPKETIALNPESMDTFADGEFSDKPPFYKSKKGILASLLILGLGTAAIVYAATYLQKQSSTSPSTAQSSKAVSRSREATSQYASFTELYKTFFVDVEQTKLKNSEFANLSKLESLLEKLKDSDYYTEAKDQYDSLKRAITAIQAVNGKFETDAIVDGEKVAAKVKADANFDDLSSETLNTGNAALDALLQSVVADGRTQNGTAPAEGTSATADKGSASSGSSASVPASSASSAKPAPSTPAASVASYGLTGVDHSILQRQLSRVPYNETMLADANNSAWIFTPGVMENIIAVSRSRGYITGDNFILERVNIINGNGYYNMFRPDGTYLFSINAKTGYFVGNGSGHADALDY